MKLNQCQENSFAIIQNLPGGLLDEAHQHGLCEGEVIKILRNRLGVPLLIELRGAQFGLRKRDAVQIDVEEMRS